MDERKLVEYFGAPCMASLATLSWKHGQEISTNGPLKAFLSSSSVPPNLRTLNYVGDDLNDLLLRYRPIRRVISIGFNPSMAPKCEDLVKKRDILTHISVQALTTTKSLFTTITEDPLPFRNIQHLGAFRLNTSTCTVRFY
ncbi:hypothetical protein CPB86DRAFT_104428 [Serendipita vermifera]|nr:hypothetical protein CPB86DRAFT_104428 [Serendipita vermifera]